LDNIDDVEFEEDFEEY